MKALKKIKQTVLALTNENDWTDQNGKPYLEGSGAQKIARFFGISWEFISEPLKVDLEEGHYRYDIRMRFFKDHDSIQVLGTRASNDPFFTTRYVWSKETNQKVQKTLSAIEVDSGNVLKASVTNAMQGILDFLGMKKLTWDDLRAGGLNIEKIQKEKSVRYKSKNDPEKPAEEQKKSDMSEADIPEEHEEESHEESAPPKRTEKPKGVDMITPNQLGAIKKMVKEPLENISVRMFGVAISDFNLLTKKEASKIIAEKLNHS